MYKTLYMLTGQLILPCFRASPRWLAVLIVGVLLLIASVAPAITFDPGHVSELAQRRYGAKGVRAIAAWQKLLSKAAGETGVRQLETVNQFWNQTLLGGEDISVWGQTDYWATPLESLVKGAGDCDDYVIGKYFSLLSAGVAPDKLRLVYVRAKIGSQSVAHMVLGYYETAGAEPLVLDSLTDAIRPASQRRDLTPVFSFNAQGVYVPGAAASTADRIGRWRGLLSKMRAEGFQP